MTKAKGIEIDKTAKVSKSKGGVKVWQRDLSTLRGAVNIALSIKAGEYAYKPTKGEQALLIKSVKAQVKAIEKTLAANNWKIPKRLAAKIASVST